MVKQGIDQKASWRFTVIAKSDKPDQPLALSNIDWYPLEGVSALPVEFQKAVPEKLRYWEEEDEEQRHKMLDALREAWDGESLDSLSEGTKRVDVRIAKADKKKGLVYGIALTANEVDSWGDFQQSETIEETAHGFMLKLWEDEKPHMIGAMHKKPVNSVVVESYIWNTEPGWLTGTEKTEENKIDTGDWILVSLVKDRKEFAKIESGEYAGYSIQGTGLRKPVKRLPPDVTEGRE